MRTNFYVKDRKKLSLFLFLIIICVFTLTIAYSALNAILTIQGNAEVIASSWDIHLENPKVRNGSATMDSPSLEGANLINFSTTLNLPGDFYEFTVDVVNGGTIDAMIENVIKMPELDDNQKKYLNYEISYQNGQSINERQEIKSGSSMPIKVRIEYRKDLNASDLPTGQVVLDLSLTLEYIQSDGTGSEVSYGGMIPISASGDINDFGTVVTIGTEQFYTIGTEGNNVKMLSMYNLYVGGVYDKSTETWTPYGEEATGMQSADMLGFKSSQDIRNGTTAFSSPEKKGNVYSDYSGSIVEGYVNNYEILLESNFGVDVIDARLITYEEAINPNNFACVEKGYCSDEYRWIRNTSFWTGSSYNNDEDYLWIIDGYAYLGNYEYDCNYYFGVRPVIVISKDYF